MAEIHLQDGESLESALKRFKRKVLQEDIKRHAFYLKPGQKKRVKAAEARKRARKSKKRSLA
jgi:small subunit ribosomal protein S21